MASADFILQWQPNWTERTRFESDRGPKMVNQSTSSIIDDLAATYEGRESIPRQETTVIQREVPSTLVGRGIRSEMPIIRATPGVESILERARNTLTNTPIKVPVERVIANTIYVPPVISKQASKPRAPRKKKVTK